MKKKILQLSVAAATLSLLAGCVVLLGSVYPYYTQKDLVFDPALTGRWFQAGDTNGCWQFADAGDKAYCLTAIDDHETNCFEAHLFQLKHYQFLDMLTTNRAEFQLPLHIVSKVVRTDTNLSLQLLDEGWLSKLLDAHPKALRHLTMPAQAGSTNDQIFALTADTEELQKFLLKHAEDTNAFSSGSMIVLQRTAP